MEYGQMNCQVISYPFSVRKNPSPFMQLPLHRAPNSTANEFCFIVKAHHLGYSSFGWPDSKIKQYESAALALTSRCIYQVGLRHYGHFCKTSGLKAYPVSQDTLKLFITRLAEQMSFKTLKLYLAVVKLNNIELGYKYKVDKMAQLHLLLRGIKLTLGNKGKRKQRLSVTLSLLKSLKQ